MNQRVLKVMGSATSTYINQYYDIASGTTTKYIYANGEPIATVTGTGGSAQVSYIHPDYLGSTNVVTDSTKAVVQALDYYPYGSIRVNQGTNQDAKKYIGQYYDDNSNLSYLNARYYDGERGQFLSEDPVFWEIGQSQDGKAVLMNPQAQNSYSYAGGNPVVNKDASGRCFEPLSAAACVYGVYSAVMLGFDIYDVVLTNFRYPDAFSREEKIESNVKLGSSVVLSVAGGKIGKDIGKAAEVLFDSLTASLDYLDTNYGDKIYNKKGKVNNPALIPQALFGSNNTNQSVLSTSGSSGSGNSSSGKSSSSGGGSLSARQAADLLRPFVKPEYRNNLERTILNTLRKN